MSNRDSARYEAERAFAALGEAEKHLQLAANFLDGPYGPALVIAMADAVYAKDRVGRIVQLLNAGRAK